MNWKYHSGYKWWEGSKGTGKFAVQKMRKGGWIIMRVPWLGNPQVITSCATKELAMKKAESYA